MACARLNISGHGVRRTERYTQPWARDNVCHPRGRTGEEHGVVVFAPGHVGVGIAVMAAWVLSGPHLPEELVQGRCLDWYVWK